VIVDGATNIRMFGEEYVVKARVETLGGLSAHAGQGQLLKWIAGFQPQPRTLLVHGEPNAQDVMAGKLWREQKLKVKIPSEGQSIVF
jgi:metallo-beta-lactamase family protein